MIKAAAAARPTGLIVAGYLCLLAGSAASAEVWTQGRKAKSAQYHTQDSQTGAYQYGYSGPHHAKTESSFNGVTRGGYSYIDANGIMQTVSYTADAENGFRVQASNLPNGNSLTPVQDTPEVASAKKRHLEQLRKADTASWQQQQDPQQQLDVEQQNQDEYMMLSIPPPQQQYRPRQYRPSQYRRQQQLLQPQQQQLQMEEQQQYLQPRQQQQQQQLEEQQYMQPRQQQQQQEEQQQQQQYKPRQRARQVLSNEARSSYLLTPEEAREIPAAPRPSAANAIVVEAAKPPETVVPVVPTRFSTASATVHQHHLIVPAMFAVPMPLVHSSMRHTQDSLGQYEYSYTGDTSAKTESRSLDGTTRGAYSYIDAHGLLQQVHYIADKDGFRVLATNLPQA